MSDTIMQNLFYVCLYKMSDVEWLIEKWYYRFTKVLIPFVKIFMVYPPSNIVILSLKDKKERIRIILLYICSHAKRN